MRTIAGGRVLADIIGESLPMAKGLQPEAVGQPFLVLTSLFGFAAIATTGLSVAGEASA